MAGRQFISPFPPTVDRNHFASWLSGFVDGEGHFRLASTLRRGKDNVYINFASFEILLRVDYVGILEMIRSYLGCGLIRLYTPTDKSRPGTKPNARFVVSNTPDVATIVVPHFDRFPLLAKKSRDYAIWREAAMLLYRVHRRPRKVKCGPNAGTGGVAKWTDAERQQFAELKAAIHAVRRYEGPQVIAPAKSESAAIPSPQLTLFGT